MLDALIAEIRAGFEGISDHRRHNSLHSLADSLSAGFAMFSLKDPSLLHFRRQFPMREQNLKRVYGIEKVCGDTALRNALDGVDPALLEPLFALPLAAARKSDLFQKRKVLGAFLLLSMDATGYYGSNKISCEHCLVKNTSDGQTLYQHQALGAVLVAPGQKEVFPVGVEPITRKDGAAKNDCETNALKRLLPKVRQTLADDKLLVTLDALYATGPTIRALLEQEMSFLITIKDGYVLQQKRRLQEEGALAQLQSSNGRVITTVRWANGLILNGANQDLLVNYLEVEEKERSSGKVLYRSCWITDVSVSADNALELTKAGRCRWKIENETFNTLKNQGYNLEHSYGHGNKYLCSVFAMLAFLAFSVDQVAQYLDKAFEGALSACKTKKLLWERVRQVFDMVPAASMEAILRFVAQRKQLPYPLIT